MKFDLDVRAYGPTPWLTRGALGAIFTCIAIAVLGITLSVEYKWFKVLDVQQRAGRDMISRVLLVDTPDRPRVLVTSDPFLRVEKGEFACISKRKLISRRWLRYGVALPGYCRSVQRPDAPPLLPLPRK